MRGITRAPFLVAAVVGAIAIALTQPPIAEAAASALTDHTITVKSGHLRVFATDVQSNISTGVALSTTISNNTAKNIYVNNGGTLTVSRFTMTITLPNNSNVSTFRRCAVNVAFTGPGICASGSPVTVTAPVSGAQTTYTLSLPGNGFYAFQINQNKTGTLGVSTSASLQYVTGAVTNS
jgi:hypothetical protein